MQILTTAAKFRSLRPKNSSNLLSSSLDPDGVLGIPTGLAILFSFGRNPLKIRPMFIMLTSSFDELSLASTSKVSRPASKAASLSTGKKLCVVSIWHQSCHIQNIICWLVNLTNRFDFIGDGEKLAPPINTGSWMTRISLTSVNSWCPVTKLFRAALAGLKQKALSSGTSLNDLTEGDTGLEIMSCHVNWQQSCRKCNCICEEPSYQCRWRVILTILYPQPLSYTENIRTSRVSHISLEISLEIAQEILETWVEISQEF